MDEAQLQSISNLITSKSTHQQANLNNLICIYLHYCNIKNLTYIVIIIKKISINNFYYVT